MPRVVLSSPLCVGCLCLMCEGEVKGESHLPKSTRSVPATCLEGGGAQYPFGSCHLFGRGGSAINLEIDLEA